ncbi:MAG: fructose-1,6-bisphosphatase [Campylobacterales bacterium]|nr:fructose-1,6-bisphosphatase [Campylobacterales bacterium]
MIEVFNAITNIAKDIEQNVFVNCDEFVTPDLSDEVRHNKVYAHCAAVIEREFEHVRSIKAAISKDKKQYCTINEAGKYLVSYVAIDNVDLLDVDFALGTIFGIYENEFSADALKAAIYITYGPNFQLVFATKTEGVKYFTHEHGEFVQQDSLHLNEKGKINATGGIAGEWSESHKALIESLFNEGYRLRFSDSLALDTHQILFKKGGLYSSPATASNPDGILEVIFEAFPIAFIIELAGGAAINGTQRILEIETPQLHQKTPIYFGSTTEVGRVAEYL